MTVVAHFDEDENGGVPVFSARGVSDQIAITSSVFQSLSMVPGQKIHWIKGMPPMDEPECGFNNEFCQSHQTCNKSKTRPS